MDSPTSSGSPKHAGKDERTQRQYHRLRRKLETRTSQEDSDQSDVRDINSINENNNLETEDSTDRQPIQEDYHDKIRQILANIKSPNIEDITPRSAKLHWTIPDIDTILDIDTKSALGIEESEFMFELEKTDKGIDGKYKCVYSGGDKNFKWKELKPGVEYFVRLRANLRDVIGEFSKVTSFRTLCCEPDPPRAPKQTARTRTSIIVRWTAPPDNGSKIASYILQSDQGSGSDEFIEVYKGPSKQYKMVKLEEATKYRVRLRAVNEVGESEFSPVSSVWTTGSPPPTPHHPLLKDADVTVLTMTWTGRDSDDIFTLQMDDPNNDYGFKNVFNGEEREYQCTGLTRNTDYRFRLCAGNDEGTSNWSDTVTYKTLPDKPGPPGRPELKGKVHADRFKVCWDCPKNDGGSDVTSYILEIGIGTEFTEVYSGPNREFTCDNLSPGTDYSLRVSAASRGGSSQYSSVGVISTSPVCPGQCDSPRLKRPPQSNSLHIKWAPPQFNGGSAIDEYEIELTNPDGSTRNAYKGRGLECVVAGLKAGKEYRFTVRAVNVAGSGPFSDPLVVVSAASPPEAPERVTVTCRSPHVALVCWTAPEDNGATIQEYRLEGSQGVCQSSGLSCEVKGLTPNCSYTFRVQAVNSAGCGPFSDEVSFVTPGSTPGPVLAASIKHEVTSNSMTLTWKTAANHGAEIVSYNIDVGDKGGVRSTGSGETQWTVEGLSPEVCYRVRIQAVNSLGAGPFSSSIKVTTLPLPPEPPVLELVGSGHNSLKLKWGEGKNVEQLMYTLYMEGPGGKFVPSYSGPGLSYKVPRLNELTTYRFRIQVANRVGMGPMSEEYSFTTTIAPPPAPKAPLVTDVTETSCRVDWQTVSMTTEDAILYQLQVQSARNSEYKLEYRGGSTNHTIQGLERKSEYTVRVGAVRVCKDGSQIPGPFSSGVRVVTVTPLAPETVQHTPLTPRESKPLNDQQYALIILAGFSVFALLLAFFIQFILSYNMS